MSTENKDVITDESGSKKTSQSNSPTPKKSSPNPDIKNVDDLQRATDDVRTWLRDNGLDYSYSNYVFYHNQIISLIPNWDSLSDETKRRLLNSPSWAQLRNFAWNPWKPNKSEKEIQQLLGQISSEFDKILQEDKSFTESTPEQDALRKLAAGYNIPLSDASSAASASVPTDGMANPMLTDPDTEANPLDFAASVGGFVSQFIGVFSSCLGFSKQIQDIESTRIKNTVDAQEILRGIAGSMTEKHSAAEIVEMAQGWYPQFAKYFKNVPNEVVESALKSKDGINNLTMSVALSNFVRFAANDEDFVNGLLSSDFFNNIGNYYTKQFEYETKRKAFESKYNADYFEQADGKNAAVSFNAKNIFDRSFWEKRDPEKSADALNELDELNMLSADNQKTIQGELLGSLTKMLNDGSGLERVFAMLMLPIYNSLLRGGIKDFMP